MFRGDGPIAIVDPDHHAGAGVIHADPWIMLILDTVRMPDGRLGGYTRIQYANGREGVAILPITKTGVVLLRHWRHATQRWHLEIPRGFGETDVDSVRQAATELLEETGLTADIEPLGRMTPDTGLLSFEVSLHVAHVHAGQTPSSDEGLAQTVEMTFDAFENAIASDVITDSFTLAAWMRYELRRRRADRR